ncbi:MAG: hypothetical protein ACK4SM_05975 [Aquificaceae bacterium]
MKAKPKPLPEPMLEVKRVGSMVYVRSLQGETEIKGFERWDEWFKKREEKAFCFDVKRLGGKSAKVCVGEALKRKPTAGFLEMEDKVLIEPEGFFDYKLYSVQNGSIDLYSWKVIKGKHSIERDYFKRCYALTGVEQDVESEPLIFCIDPKKPSEVKDVNRLEYQVVDKKIYIFWSYEPDELFEEFTVYKDGKLIGSTKTNMYEDALPNRKAVYTVKVKNRLGLESKGESVFYNP